MKLPNLKSRHLLAAAILGLSACATTTQTTTRIAIGMAQEEVLRAVGPPFSKAAEMGEGGTVEKWVYKETTWDQGGWSWNRRVLERKSCAL